MRSVVFVGGRRRNVSRQEVRDAWAKHSTRIPAQYAVGTALHEADFGINEIDTEDSGFVTKGIFQLSEEECASVPGADCMTLDGAAKILAHIAEPRLDAILKAAKLTDPVDDVWAYLAFAHNEGLSKAVKSIETHGLDWSAFGKRNPHLGNLWLYGEDCIPAPSP